MFLAKNVKKSTLKCNSARKNRVVHERPCNSADSPQGVLEYEESPNRFLCTMWCTMFTYIVQPIVQIMNDVSEHRAPHRT